MKTLLVLLLTTLVCVAQTNTPPIGGEIVTTSPLSPVVEALKPLLELLTGEGKSVVTTIIAWAAAMSLALAPFAGWISRGLRDALNRAAASSDLDDDEYLRKLFAACWYSALAFLLRFVRVDLPTLAELERSLKLQAEAVAESKTTNPT